MCSVYIYIRWERGQSHSFTCTVTHGYISVPSIVRQKQPSPEPMRRRESVAKTEALTNGNHGPSHVAAQHLNFGMPSPESPDLDDDEEEDHKTDALGGRFVVFVAFKSVQMPCI